MAIRNDMLSVLRVEKVALTLLCIVRLSWSLSSSAITSSSQKTVVSPNKDALDGKKFPRTWVPLGSIYELDPDRPTPLEFLGQKYVTYRDNSEKWIVMDDACPHRLAPLSEGRFDRDAGVVQCSYHGWEFDSSGSCTRIPQMTEDSQQAAVANLKSCVAAYPACVEKNILWVWPWKEDPLSVAGNKMAHPEGFLGGVGDDPSTYTRDTPYGWDTLVENLIDPSHVPFAHHGMQGKRTDAIPINMTMLTPISEDGYKFHHEDRTMGMLRGGTGEFRAPFVVSYDAEFKTEPKRPFGLTVCCIPTKPGWSRAIIIQGGTKEEREGEKPKKKSLPTKVFSKIPVWLTHQLSSRFLDSDAAFLHFQERERPRRSNYYMPAMADQPITALRKWIPKYTDIEEPLPPAFPRSVIFDRWMQHTSHCKHCQAGLKTIKKWRRSTYAALVTSILGFQFRIAKVSTLLCFGILRLLQKLENSMKEGEFKHYENH